MNLKCSKDLFERTSKRIPWGTQTNAKKWPAGAREYFPAFIQRGKGCRIWDVDGNEYIDFKCACGPVILGYADDEVNAAVKRQIDEGTMYNMAHPLEIELAERIAALVPCAERVRFLKTGSDATCAAVRIARTVTGRDKVISFGYHGWNDMTNACNLGLGSGIPPASRELVIKAKPHDLEGFKQILGQHGKNTAIVIMDLACHHQTDPQYLKTIQALCRENGSLLCFDEIITGFRYALGGAQAYYGVTPDLGCFAKAMANGYSISALCGRAEVMDAGFAKTIITGTYYGATTDIAAAIATIDKLQREKVPELLWQRGRKLKTMINELLHKHGLNLRADGVDCLFYIAGDSKQNELFSRLLLEQGVFPGSSYWFMQYAHTDDVLDRTGKIVETVCRKMKP